MKKIICCLAAFLFLLCAACAEEAPAQEILLVSPTPTIQPMGETFSSEDLIVTLPCGLTILTGENLSGYTAAMQADFPDAGSLLLAAVNAENSAAASFIIMDGETSAEEAANEAARIILGDHAAVTQMQYGANHYASFSCGIGEDVYRLFFLSGNEKLLLVGTSGVSEAEIETMLSGLNF